MELRKDYVVDNNKLIWSLEDAVDPLYLILIVCYF